MRNKLIDELSRKGRTFTFREALAASSLEPSSLGVLLHRLEKRGEVERIEREKYMIVPLGAKKEEYTLHEFIVGTLLVSPSCIGYWSALNHHGITDQRPNGVFVQTTSRKKHNRGTTLGVNYRIISLSDRKFFGFENIWMDGERIQMTDREKTIADCMDRPDLCGGIIHTVKGFEPSMDTEKLIAYSRRMGNTGILRRIGFLMDLMGIEHGLERIYTRNYLYLDPTMPKRGVKDPKWKLMINVELNDLRDPI